MSQATWPSYKSWSFPMALRARRCPPEFLLFQDVLYWNDLRKELECFGCFQEFSKKVSNGFLLSGRQNVIWQTFGKHWQTCKREVFHFYILFLLGFMSGLAAGQGSRFMSLGGKGAVPAYALTYLIYSLLFLSSLSSGFLFVCLFVCLLVCLFVCMCRTNRFLFPFAAFSFSFFCDFPAFGSISPPLIPSLPCALQPVVQWGEPATLCRLAKVFKG